jgi:hypothetical protein
MSAVISDLSLLLAKGLNNSYGIQSLLSVASRLTVGFEIVGEATLHCLHDEAHHDEHYWKDEQEDQGHPPTAEESEEKARK